jgi:molecular chaperone DnaJ
MSKDYYIILGVDRNSSKDDIKKAFRKLAHKYHPDKSGGDDKKFKEISEAFAVLSDDSKKAEYDAYGQVFGGRSPGGQSGFGFEGFDFSNFENQGGFQEFDFGDIFSGIFGDSRRRVQRGRDISVDLEIPFADSVFGTSRTILLTKTSMCALCSGSGAKEGAELQICNTCNGKGKLHETRKSLVGTFTNVRTCSTCRGHGKIPVEKCKQCSGSGVERKPEEIVVTIPPGINDNEMIRLNGVGEAIQSGVPGDLYAKIHVTPDNVFSKEGNNLRMKLSLKLSEALLGGERRISTLDGDMTVKIPQGMSFGETLRVRGKGIPVDKNSRGDLLIKLDIQLPKKLTRKTKKLVDELRQEGI